MKYIIVGGVAGGATAAARIRRIDEQAEIVLIEKGHYISYANCGLPYYIGNTITERDRLFVQTPASFGKRFAVDVRVDSEVTHVNVTAKQLTIRKLQGEEYTETYDKLLLSPGSSPVRPSLKGIDSEGIFTLRNVEDTDRIKQYTLTHSIRKVVIVGAGFIGLEMAENLHNLGAEVSIVEMGNQVMAPIDFSMASHVHQHLLQKGVRLFLTKTVERFEAQPSKSITVHFSTGEKIEADLVLLSIGVRPETGLAAAAGLKIGEAHGIWVNEYLQTSAPDVYAVGDAIEFPHPLTGKPWLNYLANPANRQGRIVADNMVKGNHVKYEGAIGTSIAKVFDLTVASTGLAAKRLQQLGIAYQSSTTHSASHAGYYPGSLPLTVKLIFDPTTGKLYGAQVVGCDGVDKRIDQLALLLKKGGTIYDLIQLEHAYAPPYSSAKDPIAIGGYVAGNIINGSMPVVSWRELHAILKTSLPAEYLLLDVRTAEEFAFSAISGAVNIPLDELRDRLSEIPIDKPIYVYCAVGLRGYLALKILTARGYKEVKNLSGGYKTYSTALAPVICTVGSCPLPVSSEITQSSADSMPSSASPSINCVKIDASGLQCPGPILKVKTAIESIGKGDQVEIVSTDTAFSRDVAAWCKSTGNLLLSNTSAEGCYTVLLEKENLKEIPSVPSVAVTAKGKSFILFSDDLDKALATFVLANGAAATGEKVTIFFTFWGLNAIKKENKPSVQKDFFGKMFSMMLPSSSKKLALSKLNMGGIGAIMMRYLMKKKGVESLESLRASALAQGVEFIACQMSMDVMGVKREELLDEVTVGGVATYMERAENSNVNLFI